MEKFAIETDLQVICVEATTFPTGVMKAHVILHAKFADADKRKFFGISHGRIGGSIIYKAAAEELFDGEAAQLNCETFLIRKGAYISQFVAGFRDDPQSVGNAFQLLLTHPQIDPNGYCLEMYSGETDVRCLVPLAK
jgi:hypothetical protein